MGFYMSQQECSFLIKKENFEAALNALKEAPSENWDWVDSCALRKTKSLPEAFKELRWEAVIDPETGDIINLYFMGEKEGSEDEWMRVISPYVEDRSYIQMTGEGATWRWCFLNGKMEVHYSFVSWTDWERIFTVILSRKEIIPLLVGIDPELDLMISNSLKEKGEENR